MPDQSYFDYVKQHWADPIKAIPPHVQRLVDALKNLSATPGAEAAPMAQPPATLSLRANPSVPLSLTDPSTAEGIGGAARKKRLDQLIDAQSQ